MLPQVSIFGFPEEPSCQSFVLFNYCQSLNLMFKIPVTIQSCVFVRDNLLRDVTRVKKIEKRETYLSQKKITQYKLHFQQ